MVTPVLDWSARIASHVAEVEQLLDSRLAGLRRRWHAEVVGESGGGAAFDVDPPALLRDMLERGGKRTRPVMTYLGWIAGDGHRRDVGHPDVVRAGAAVELLHAFALVHDDVMDESDTRRGRPTLHRNVARLHRAGGGRGSSERFGESVAVLVGDLAHAEADRLAATLPAPLSDVWQQLVLELVAGQLWDLTGSAAADRRLSFARSVARQKTGNYTVARPLQLGAAAAQGSPELLAALGEYGRHAGEAFALRDDMLGAYGDPAVTGKPAGDDLRSGKPTVLLAMSAQLLTGPAIDALAVAGTAEMTAAQVCTLQQAMLEQGVVERVEAMIDERIGDALDALAPGVVSADGIEQLTRVVDELTRRGR
ncbi:polyprenyl synthetase family protein [uncultured Jatrophihabitans sp.]|uniref:polyprenyl synthetase family protein n=1 Tax=uncultured Jatrophihabitans sp. TaxID=1610747 RepID=UPI0035CB4543